MTIGIGASALFFVKQCELEIDSRLLFVLTCVLLPNHFVTLELMYLWAGYYAIHVIVLFFALGVYIRLLKGKKLLHGEISLRLLPIGFSFCMGLQGTRNILILSGPLLCLEILRVGVKWVKGSIKKKDIAVFLWTLALLVSGLLGMMNGLSIGQDLSRNIRNGMSKLCGVVLPEAAGCIGLQEGTDFGKILLWLCIWLLIMDIVKLVWKFCKSTEVSTEEWIQLFFVLSPVMTMMVVAFTTIESSERYYFIFLYAIAFSIVRQWNEGNARLRKLIGGGMFCLFLVNIFSVYKPIISAEEGTFNEQMAVVEYLKENDCEIGYASFENANSMTVLANGSVRVAAVASVERMDMCKWLSSTEWYGPYIPFKTKTAYIVTETEQEAFDTFWHAHKKEVEYEIQIGKYLIYMSDYNFSKAE